MKAIQSYSRFLDVLTKILKVILIVLLSAMVIISFYQVIMRYIFANAQPWCEELTIYLAIFSIMLALGIASRRDSHLQVDFLTRLYPPRIRCLMTAVWSAVTIVIMLFFTYYAIHLIGAARAHSVTMPVTTGQIYTAFPIGAIILIIYSIEIIARNLIGFANNGELPALPSEMKGEEAQ